mgnify:CR=1 FL=1
MGPIDVLHEPGIDGAFWLLKGLVCSNLAIPEIEKHLLKHPPGTTHGWQIRGKRKPCAERKGYFEYEVFC